MRIRHRQRVLPGREPADPFVRREPREVDAQAGQDEPGAGELPAGAGAPCGPPSTAPAPAGTSPVPRSPFPASAPTSLAARLLNPPPA
ncbi:hypothetical protein K4G64_17115, partial [Streptomyces sp. WAC04114]|nr:hypothetical protein [Streptomyces sp. WAC04114]